MEEKELYTFDGPALSEFTFDMPLHTLPKLSLISISESFSTRFEEPDFLRKNEKNSPYIIKNESLFGQSFDPRSDKESLGSLPNKNFIRIIQCEEESSHHYLEYAVQHEYENFEHININNRIEAQDISRIASAALRSAIRKAYTGLPLSQILNSSPNTLPNAFGQNSSYNISTRLEAKHLPEMALPIIDFMKRVQPDIVIGCDRGGRLFSLAIKSAWDATEDERFPTVDHKVHFARVSKSEDFALMQERIDEIIESTRRAAAQKGEPLPDDWEPKIMFVDDWVVGGGTKRLAEKLVEKHKAIPYFVVMTGDGADASGDHSRYAGNVAWHDRPEEIGVNYISSVKQDTDGSMIENKKAVVVKTTESRKNRAIIKKAARLLGAQPNAKAELEEALELLAFDESSIPKAIRNNLVDA